jgi:2-polyprenyl-3-methyl-5-hydroxy-6-metoxy-1,4-benzoquinol methylase
LNEASATTERGKAYGSARPEVLRVLPAFDGPVLDVGCHGGAVGVCLKQRGPGLVVWGIELDAAAASVASTHLDRVLQLDAAAALDELAREDFEPGLVILADILEHLVDPWSVFDRAVALLRPGGHVVVSLPNVGHWDTHYNLLRGRWPYRSRGIHDDTHLRFFARRNVIELMNRGPVHMTRLKRVLRLVERPSPVNRLAPLLCWPLPGPFTYQFLAVSTKRG